MLTRKQAEKIVEEAAYGARMYDEAGQDGGFFTMMGVAFGVCVATGIDVTKYVPAEYAEKFVELQNLVLSWGDALEEDDDSSSGIPSCFQRVAGRG